MVSKRKNKLSIFLLKESCSSFAEALDEEKEFKKIDLDSNKTFYYVRSFSNIPHWVKDFFSDKLNAINDIKSASAKGLLLTKIKCEKNKERIFAVVFGHGRFLLKKKYIEGRFGLKVVLNIINYNSIRKIEKKDISSIPKYSIEQRTKVGNRLDFGINIEQELIQGVTGLVKTDLINTFSKNVTGKDFFSLSAKNNLENINALLINCYKKYKCNDYKPDFGWIDQIMPIKNNDLTKSLNDKLINEINKDDETVKIWMVIPEVIDWEKVEGFNYSNSFEELKEDIFLSEFLNNISSEEKNNLNPQFLKSSYIYAFDTNHKELFKWSVYDCLYAELEEENKTYLLSNGDWFEIEKSFVEEINNFFNNFLDINSNISFILPECDVKTEGAYNEKVANGKNIILMDKKPISYGGGHSSIEFCDLMSNQNEFIHVKKYGGSSVLSHLFNQGLVPSELIKMDKNFITEVNKKLPKSHHLPETIDTKEYKIIFVILSKGKSDLSIPFFSKISLKNAVRRLTALGYNVYLEKIKNTYGEEN